MDMKDKSVLVMGGAGGFGRAIVTEFMKHGAKVTACDIDEKNGQELCEELGSKYGYDRILFFNCDVTDYTRFEEIFHTVIETFGSIDIFVNNAAILNDRLWELEVDVNLNGVIRGTLLALQFMGKKNGGRGGVIINIGSNCGLKPYVSAPIYSATKQAVIGLSRGFGAAFHLNTTGVKVIAFCPSATEAGGTGSARKQFFSTDYKEAWEQDTANLIPQKNEYVARCLVQIIPTAPSGSVWLVENSLPPRQIENNNL